MLIDVSNHQGTIDWHRTDPAIDGAYVKVTEGTGYTDPFWPANHAGAVAGGKPVGAYHFATGADPVVEANHFADQHLRAAWQLDPVLDAEVPAVGWAWVVAFRAQFRKRTGVSRFRLYTSTGYLTGQLNPANWIDAASTIWAAHYAAAIGWSHPQLVLWQNTNAATIPGVLGNVDADQFMNGWTPASDRGADMTPDEIKALFAQLSDIGKRVASMHAGGYLPWPQPAGAPAAPGGDLTWFQQQSATALKPVLAQLSTLSGALSADEAAILGAVQGADNDTKAGIAQLATTLAAVDADVKAGVVSMSDAQLKTLEADLTAAFGPSVVAQLGAAITKGSA
jgi:hypothetical protein